MQIKLKKFLGICEIKNCIIELILIKTRFVNYSFSSVKLREQNKHLNEGCTNLAPQVARETKFYAVAHIICNSTALNLPHITILAPLIFSFLDFFKNICTPLHNS